MCDHQPIYQYQHLSLPDISSGVGTVDPVSVRFCLTEQQLAVSSRPSS